MPDIVISEETAKVCLQALGELPLKLSFAAVSEIIAKVQAAQAPAVEPIV